MKILNNNFNDLKPMELVSLECEQCSGVFEGLKTDVASAIKLRPTSFRFCSDECRDVSLSKKVDVICTNCGIPFKKLHCQFLKSDPNHFHNRSCSATYLNKHKKFGVNRSRAELLIESLVRRDFPDTEIQTNVRAVLDSGLEIDILLPEINIAIELNGPVHYFPIYGDEKFKKTKNNDLLKQIEIQEKGINLIVVDISQMKYWKKTILLLTEYYNNYLKPIIEDSIK
jgi:hypothetical protein